MTEVSKLYNALTNFTHNVVIQDSLHNDQVIRTHIPLNPADFPFYLEWRKYKELCNSIYLLLLKCSKSKDNTSLYYAARKQCLEFLNGTLRFLANCGKFTVSNHVKKYHFDYLLGVLYKQRISNNGIATTEKSSTTMRKYIEYIFYCVITNNQDIKHT